MEELDPVRAAKLGQNVVELLPRKAGPRGDAEADVLEDLVGLMPGQELRELVGGDEEDRVLAEAGHGVDRVRVVVADDRVVRESEPREDESSLDIDVDACVRWVRRDVYAQRIDVEAALRGFGEQHVTIVGRIERPAQQAGAGHASSNAYSPTSPSQPRGAPA